LTPTPNFWYSANVRYISAVLHRRLVRYRFHIWQLW